MKKIVSLATFIFLTINCSHQGQNNIESRKYGQFTMVKIPSGIYKPFIKEEYYKEKKINGFELMEVPVTKTMFEDFLANNNEWKIANAKKIFIESNYLKNYDLLRINEPVTFVSWFAANAFCDFYGMRLPKLEEWEYASLASDSESQNAVYHWLSTPGISPDKEIKKGVVNKFGLYDMHALIWEWVEDFNQVMINADSRGKNDKSVTGAFCGAGTLTTDRAMEYATYMRFALRGSIKANYTLGNLGFRCAI